MRLFPLLSLQPALRLAGVILFGSMFLPAAVYAGVPSGWGGVDVGAPTLAGSASYTNGTWTLSGGGAGIGGTSDQFSFCTNNLSGDGAILGRVLSQTGTDTQAVVGVMIRNDETANTSEASILVTTSSNVVFRSRSVPGSATVESAVAGVTAPIWLRLSRSANSITASYSVNGLSWTQLGSPQAVTAAPTALAGLAVSSHNDSLINTVKVNNVLIVPGPQVGVPAGLTNPFTGQIAFAGETTWPLPQIDVASNAPTPRMGWNSWFVVGDAIGPTESLIESTADALVTNGFAAAGYRYLVMDCTWIAPGRGSRDTNGVLNVDPSRWPDGMKAVADYVHGQGLFLGGYSDIGTLGYGTPPQVGGFAWYQQDADQFAQWGWDFIKIDDHGAGDFCAAAYAITHNALARPMVVSLSTPQVDRLQFAPRIANSWRVANDISFTFGTTSWGAILTEFDTAQVDWVAQGPGRCNDPDMLTTGLKGITDTEGRSQFNMWCILGAPLMIGTDVRTAGGAYAPPLSAATLETLTNTEVIAVDQDLLGAVGRPVAGNVYVKPLGSFASGQFAVLLLNRSVQDSPLAVNWADMGLVSGSSASVRDLWAHQDLGVFAGGYTSPPIPSHGSMVLRVSGTYDWNRPRTYEAEWGFNTLGGSAYSVPHTPSCSAGAYVTGVGGGPANILQFNRITAPSPGLYEVDIYYSSPSNRTAQWSINGGAPSTVSFPGTASLVSPGVVAAYAQLNAGENIILFSNASDLAPDFDKILVSGGAPANLNASGGDSLIQLDWTPLAGAASYNIYRGSVAGGESQQPLATGLTTVAYTDVAVVNGSTYYYFVTAVNPTLGGEGPPSVEAGATPRFATASGAYLSAVLAAHPTAYWHLDETNGTVAVDQIGGHNGTYGGAVTLGLPGPRPPDFLGFGLTNTAVQFTNNVTNSWVIILSGVSLPTNSATFTAWINPTAAQADSAAIFFSRAGTTASGLNYGSVSSTNAQTLGYTWNNDSATWSWNSGLMPPMNLWSFVALVVQPTNATLYLMNAQGQQSATNFHTHPLQTFSSVCTIGTDVFARYARIFSGLIDEVAVFNYTLSPSQLLSLYQCGSRLPQVQLNLAPTNSLLNVSWPQGTLFQSSSAAGPWLPVTGALSPWLSSPSNPATFYRVLVQQ